MKAEYQVSLSTQDGKTVTETLVLEALIPHECPNKGEEFGKRIAEALKKKFPDSHTRFLDLEGYVFTKFIPEPTN